MTNLYVKKISDFTHTIFPRCKNIVSKFVFSSQETCNSKILILKKGKKDNIHKYIKQAEKKGVRGIILENRIEKKLLPKKIPLLQIPNLGENLNSILDYFYSKPMQNMYIIGVTGTDGKTSTCHHLAQFLSSLYPKKIIGVITSEGNGIYPNLIKTNFTTPDNHILYNEYKKFYKKNVNILIIECSSQGLDQGRLNYHSFNTSILTNIYKDHIDYHKSISQYIESKLKLFEMTKDFILLNSQSKKIKNKIKNTDAKKLIYKETDSPCGFNGTSVQIDLFEKLALIFKINSKKKIASAASSVKPVVGRFNIIKGRNNQVIIIDYAHTPSSLIRVCKKAIKRRSFSNKNNKLIIVFGCGGDRDKSKRKEMGSIACKYASHTIITDDNPRSENPKTITREICSVFGEKDSFEVINDRKKAIRRSIQLTSENDIVLIIGKGNESDIMYNNKKLKHNDIQYVKTLSR